MILLGEDGYYKIEHEHTLEKPFIIWNHKNWWCKERAAALRERSEEELFKAGELRLSFLCSVTCGWVRYCTITNVIDHRAGPTRIPSAPTIISAEVSTPFSNQIRPSSALTSVALKFTFNSHFGPSPGASKADLSSLWMSIQWKLL